MQRAAVLFLLITAAACGLSSRLMAQPLRDVLTPPPVSEPTSDENADRVFNSYNDYFSTRFDLRHDTGPGVGYRKSFTTFGAFVPLYQMGPQIILMDARAFVSNTGEGGGNLGFGYRFFDESTNRIWGINSFYDYRDTGNNSFHQWGLGFESLGDRLDFRFNADLPGGNRSVAAEFFSQRTQTTTSLAGAPLYQGRNLVLNLASQNTIFTDRYRQYESPMGGFDFEFGGPPWFAAREKLTAYAGAYHFQGSGVPQAWGVRSRVQWNPFEWVSLNLSLSHDKVFDTTLACSAAFYLPAPMARQRDARTRNRGERLDEPIIRNTNIVVKESEVFERAVGRQTFTTFSQQLAINPATGQPIIIVHADGNATNAGDGSFENPFRTLTSLQNGSNPGNILLLHAGSRFTEAVILQDNQRLLGDGDSARHSVATVQAGVIALPRTNALAAQPILTGSFTPLVQLANGNQVSGLTLTSSPLAIMGTNVQNFTIDRNSILNNQQGIILVNASGVGRITDNVISGTATGAGVRLESTSPTPLDLTISENTLRNSGTNGGIFMNLGGNSRVTTNILNNLFENHTEAGIALTTTDTAQVNARIVNNRLDLSTNATGQGIRLISTNASTITSTITDNFIATGANGAGVFARSTNTSTFNTTLLRNQASGSLNGVDALATDTSIMTAIGENNIFRQNGAQGANFVSDTNATIRGRFNNNQFLNNGDSGFRYQQQGASTLNVFGVQNNLFAGNANQGLNINNDAGQIGLRLTGNQSDNGYLLDQNGGVFNAEDGYLNQTTGTVTTNAGTITTIPPGSLIIP